MLKKLLKFLLFLVVLVAVAAAGLVGYLSLTEYRPEAVEVLSVTPSAQTNVLKAGSTLKVVSFNTGYAGLGSEMDFFMDGGTKVLTDSQATVERNQAAILSVLNSQNADILLLQEVDRSSKRTWYMDQAEYYRSGLSMNMAFAYNYKCAYVPFPWPTLGKVESGLCTFTNLQITAASRVSLPCPFSWPMSTANLKRCLLVERVPVEGTDKELVIVNLHLEAYDDGAGKEAQTKQLMELIQQEYAKGNYVLVGGDFNQTFEEAQGKYPILNSGEWTPGVLLNASLPAGFSFVYDASSPSCRSLKSAYTGDRANTTFYLIDGYIVSDNLQVDWVETVDLDFQNSDHNPVALQVTLK